MVMMMFDDDGDDDCIRRRLCDLVRFRTSFFLQLKIPNYKTTI